MKQKIKLFANTLADGGFTVMEQFKKTLKCLQGIRVNDIKHKERFEQQIEPLAHRWNAYGEVLNDQKDLNDGISSTSNDQ